MKAKKKSSKKPGAKKSAARKPAPKKSAAKSKKPVKKAPKKAVRKTAKKAVAKKAAPKKAVKKAAPKSDIGTPAPKKATRTAERKKPSEQIIGEEMPTIIVEETRIEPVDDDLKEFMRDESEMRIPKSPSKRDAEDMDEYKSEEDFKVEDEPGDFQDDDEDY